MPALSYITQSIKIICEILFTIMCPCLKESILISNKLLQNQKSNIGYNIALEIVARFHFYHLANLYSFFYVLYYSPRTQAFGSESKLTTLILQIVHII